jgi:hypothetical protein
MAGGTIPLADATPRTITHQAQKNSILYAISAQDW